MRQFWILGQLCGAPALSVAGEERAGKPKRKK